MEKKVDVSLIKKPLSLNEIDFRIQSISEKGFATVLAYKDARVDMNRLDEVFGVFGWQKKYELIDGKLFCHVGIKNHETGEWVWKSDVGTESNTEKEKGQASDSFKRACFNIGIGRELYEFPKIQFMLHKDEFSVSEINGKKIVRQTFNLKLSEWEWHIEYGTENEILFLGAKDNNGNLRYKHDNRKK